MSSSLSSLATFNGLYAAKLRSSLKLFVQQAWQFYEPAKPLIWTWHLDVLCNVLEQVKRGTIKRLIINIPPGCSKSSIVSVMFPTWWWASEPSLRIFEAAYSEDNTIRDNLKVKGIVTSDWFQSLFWGPSKDYPTGVSLSSDQSGKVRFNNTVSGWRLATSVGGTGTGEHPNLIIIDDPLKAIHAYSEAELRKNQLWYDSTISTRRTLDPAEVIVMQRLHDDDLSGYALSKGEWSQDGTNAHLLLPMEYECQTSELNSNGEPNPSGKWPCQCHRNGPDKRDIRTVDGELICPDVVKPSVVAHEKLILGPLGSSGQLQQRPVPLSGGLFKRENFKIIDVLPSNVIDSCRGWDVAETEGGGNWTVGTRIDKTADGKFIVVHNDRSQIGTGDVDKRIKHFAAVDGRKTKIAEGSGSGKAVTNKRAIDLAGWDYKVISETESKILRSNAFRAQCEAGNVYVLKGDWNEAFISVMCAFPLGKVDDDVDAAGNAFNRLTVSKSYAGTGRLMG